jgi:hypothetical protein
MYRNINLWYFNTVYITWKYREPPDNLHRAADHSTALLNQYLRYLWGSIYRVSRPLPLTERVR